MIKENIKTVVLIILVLLSLFMTFQLWYGKKPAELIEEDAYESVEMESPRSLEQIVTPETIALRVEGGYYLFQEGNPQYYILWEALSSLLLQLEQKDLSEVEVDASTLTKTAFLACLFDPALPVGDESKLLTDLNGSQLSTFAVLMNGETPGIILIESEQQRAYRAEFSEADSLALVELLQSIGDTERTLYRILSAELLRSAFSENLEIKKVIYVPSGELAVERLKVRPETLDRDKLLKTFFVDYTLARTIEEKGGAMIYTDGERGLRITDQGLEYSHPRLEEGQINQTFSEAIYKCGSLLSFHGGWPTGLRLESIRLSAINWTETYDAQWRMYFYGYPVFAAKPTRILFNDRGLIHYSRSIYNSQALEQEELESKIVADWQAALRSALAVYVQEINQTASTYQLEALSPGYAIMASFDGFIAEPIWHVRLNGYNLMLKADTLTPINWEELQ